MNPFCELIGGPLDGLQTRGLKLDNTSGLPAFTYQNYGKPWRYVYQAQDFLSELPEGAVLRLYFVQMVHASEVGE